MDAVTAGAAAVADAGAVGGGSFGLTNANTGAVVTARQGSHPSQVSHVGAAAGTASAVGAGPSGDTDTSVAAAASADGTFTFGSSTSWTVKALSGEASGGFAFAYGSVGAFLLGGP